MRRGALTVAVTLALAPASARAQPALDPAAAETLFVEGRRLMSEGKHGEACPKLAESQRLDPGTGTLYNLSDCYEKIGKTASAWAGFAEVARQSKAAGNAAREADARARAGALEPTLPKLIVRVPEPAKGIVVKRDDVEMGAATWGAAVPIDPGEHTLAASAPGKKPWELTFVVKARPEPMSVAVPALEDAPVDGPKERVVLVENRGRTQRAVGLVVGGVGLVAVGVGAVFGAISMGKKSDADALAPSLCKGNVCGDPAFTLRDEAYSAGSASTVAFTLGAIALAAGAVLFFTAPRSPSTGVAVTMAGPLVRGEW